MGKQKSHRSSLKIAAVIRKKAKAKRQRERKEAKTKQYPKRSRKMLHAPQSLPHREEIEAFVHESSDFLNKVIRPIESTRDATKSAGYFEQLAQFRREITEKHKQRLILAKENYSALTEALSDSDLVIEVLDARDPNSCRLLQAESARLASKPLLIVLNKIDLVPRDSVTRWIGTLRTIAPTVAISANSPEPALWTIREAIDSVVPGAAQIAVIGIRGVGKSTICAFNPEILKEIPGYSFIAQTSEMGLLRGTDFLDPLYDLAVEVLGRVSDDSVYGALEMSVQESPKAILQELAKRWKMKPRLAGQRFIEMIWTGDYRWYGVPDDTEALDFTEAQLMALQASTPFELTTIPYIALAAGDSLTVDERLLEFEPEDEEEEEEEDEAEDEE